MPSSTPALCARWDGPSDEKALEHLRAAGYTLNRGFTWTAPQGRIPTEEDYSAILFLIEEWDFGGLEGLRATLPPKQAERSGEGG